MSLCFCLCLLSNYDYDTQAFLFNVRGKCKCHVTNTCFSHLEKRKSSKYHEPRQLPIMSDFNVTQELKECIHLISTARMILLSATTALQLLYARILWRTAELRFMTYQVAVGDVVVDRASRALAATTRAMEQLYAKLVTDVGFDDNGKVMENVTLDDPLFIQMARLSHLASCLFFEGIIAQKRVNLTMATLQDWYIKMTFVITTMQASSVLVKRTSFGFPEKENDDRLNHENMKTTHLLVSLVILRVPKDQQEDDIQGEVIAAMQQVSMINEDGEPGLLSPMEITASGSSEIKKARKSKKTTKKKAEKAKRKKEEHCQVQQEAIPSIPNTTRSYADVVKTRLI